MNTHQDHICIRGHQLPLADLVDRRLFDPVHLAALRHQLLNAEPYAHLEVSDWFNASLLELVHEEFDLYPQADLQAVHTKRESTFRSQAAAFGPATSLYFSIVNAGWFVNLLSSVSGVSALVPDPGLHGGGLHESREGGRFHVHRDFDRHPRTGLCNEMVLLTYLNKGWDASWHGELELWDASSARCVKTIAPEFGRTVLLRNSPISFHGHVAPLTPPAGRTRRSLGAYYYSNRFPLAEQGHRPTVFMTHDRVDRMKLVLKNLVPPILWQAIKRVAEH
ncbi:MAG: 2OG-Fe(II) oxygenase [Rhizobacter sp.]